MADHGYADGDDCRSGTGSGWPARTLDLHLNNILEEVIVVADD
jgi:hypothetical protein